MFHYRPIALLLISIACPLGSASMIRAAEPSIAILPNEVQLHGSFSQQRVSVVAIDDDRIGRELISEVQSLTLVHPDIAEWDGQTLRPLSDGETELVAKNDERRRSSYQGHGLWNARASRHQLPS